MKKIIKLTESDLIKIVKKVIKETNTIEVSPYKLTITKNGNIEVNNNGSIKTYELYKVIDYSPDIKLTAIEFSNDGKFLTVSAMGFKKTKEIDKDKIKTLIKQNWTKTEINYPTKDGTIVLFKQIL